MLNRELIDYIDSFELEDEQESVKLSKNLLEDIRDKLPQEKLVVVDELFEIFKGKSHTPRFFLVGGALRDIFLNIPSEDLDIEVHNISQDKFDEVMSSIAEKVGKSFLVYKYKGIDFSLPRVEKKVGEGHKAFEVSFTDDIHLATKRRDFKMNALMLDIYGGEFYDFFGGVDDIRNKTISIIDEDSFKEDSLRVLRAMQFAARFGFKIDDDSLDIMKDISLDDLSKHRVFTEFEKMFGGHFLEYGLFAMAKLEIDKNLFKRDIFSKRFVFFLKASRELMRVKNIDSGDISYSKKLLFLYIFLHSYRVDRKSILESIGAPNLYNAILKQPKSPIYMTNRFLLSLARKTPISEYLGSYKDEAEIRRRSVILGIWDTRLKPTIDTEEFDANNIDNASRKELIDKNYKDIITSQKIKFLTKYYKDPDIASLCEFEGLIKDNFFYLKDDLLSKILMINNELFRNSLEHSLLRLNKNSLLMSDRLDGALKDMKTKGFIKAEVLIFDKEIAIVRINDSGKTKIKSYGYGLKMVKSLGNFTKKVGFYRVDIDCKLG